MFSSWLLPPVSATFRCSSFKNNFFSIYINKGSTHQSYEQNQLYPVPPFKNNIFVLKTIFYNILLIFDLVKALQYVAYTNLCMKIFKNRRMKILSFILFFCLYSIPLILSLEILEWSSLFQFLFKIESLS